MPKIPFVQDSADMSTQHSTMAAPSLCVAKKIRAYFQTGLLPEPGTVCEADEKPLIGSSPSSTQIDRVEDYVLLSAMEDRVRNYKMAQPFLPL